MYGIDISNYQKGIDLSAARYDFAIIKATEGINYVDKSFKNFAVQLTELGKFIGCYHFVRPDLHTTSYEMEAEADNFLEIVNSVGLLYKAILVLDWEKEPFDNEELVYSWLNRVYTTTHVKPFIYGSKSKLTKWRKWETYKSFPIWMAAWPTISPNRVGGPIIGKMQDRSLIDWKIWQYSANGIYPGANFNVDLDYTDMSREEWIKYAEGDIYSPLKSDFDEAMKWAIDCGIIHGDGQGNYLQKDNITREEMIAILYRYHNIYNN